MFLYVGEGDVIEFMGAADVVIGNAVYPFRLTDLATSKPTTCQTGKAKISLVDPVYTLLLKALLRRGADQGKHDLEDMEAVMAKTAVDTEYLASRLEEVGGTIRTADIWRRYGVTLK